MSNFAVEVVHLPGGRRLKIQYRGAPDLEYYKTLMSFAKLKLEMFETPPGSKSPTEPTEDQLVIAQAAAR